MTFKESIRNHVGSARVYTVTLHLIDVFFFDINIDLSIQLLLHFFVEFYGHIFYRGLHRLFDRFPSIKL